MKNKNIKLKTGVIALLAGLYNTGAVAETTNGVAVASVIEPLILAATQTMDFGTVASNSTGGTLSMDSAGAVTSATLDVISATGSTLQFTIQGEAGQAYTLNIADGVLSDGGSPANTMALTITGNDDNGSLAASGVPETVTVTGDLTVGASQAAGSYSTANSGGTAIVITANYN
jgi:hypothetical protein